MKILAAFITERIAEARDIWAAVVDVFSSKPHDPTRHAEKPPDGWNGAKEATLPQTEWIQPIDGGFPNTYDANGLHYQPPFAVTVAEQRMERASNAKVGLTEKEMGEMKEYRVSPTQKGLHNITLAIRIKKHWQEGKKPREIGLLVGCSESTARHYCLCFERANPSPI